MAEHYDVIVIGSGRGGGSLAQLLPPTGKRLLMLERGSYLPRPHIVVVACGALSSARSTHEVDNLYVNRRELLSFHRRRGPNAEHRRRPPHRRPHQDWLAATHPSFQGALPC